MNDSDKDQQESHREHVADTLRPVLQEGDSFNVYCQDGEVYVADAETSALAAVHPRVYGRLLAIDADLERNTTAFTRLPFLALAVFTVGLHLRWWDDWIGANIVDKVDSIWFYILLFIGLYQLFAPIRNRLDRTVYQRHREDLLSLMADERIDRDTLLAMVESDGALARIAYQLKLDTEAVRRKE